MKLIFSFFLFILILLCLVFLPSCKSTETIVQGVNTYCQKPLEERLAYRILVNSQLVSTGHTITVNCANDPN